MSSAEEFVPAWQETIYAGIDPVLEWITPANGVLWRGIGSTTTNAFLYQVKLPWKTSGWGTLWFMAHQQSGLPHIRPVIQDINSNGTYNTWTASLFLHNGRRYWHKGSGSSAEVLWWSGSQWIISSRLGLCTYERWDTSIPPTTYTFTPASDIADPPEEDPEDPNPPEFDPYAPYTYFIPMNNAADIEEVHMQNAWLWYWEVYEPPPPPDPDDLDVPEPDPDAPTVPGLMLYWSEPQPVSGQNPPYKQVTVYVLDYYYIGNAWWEGTGGNLEGVYQARGSNRGTKHGQFLGAPRKVVWRLDGFLCKPSPAGVPVEPPAGIYSRLIRTATIDDEGTITEVIEEPDTPTRIVGLGSLVWRDGGNVEYIRSPELVNDRYTYSTLVYNTTTSSWVIGAPGTFEWWEGPLEPQQADMTYKSMSWGDQDGNYYTRSATMSGSWYTYNTIAYNPTFGVWVKGNYGSPTGWYEGVEPTDGTVVFERRKTAEGNYPGSYNLNVTRRPSRVLRFQGIPLGSNEEDVMIVEVGLWC